jgi:hypothetical protein
MDEPNANIMFVYYLIKLKEKKPTIHHSFGANWMAVTYMKCSLATYSDLDALRFR